MDIDMHSNISTAKSLVTEKVQVNIPNKEFQEALLKKVENLESKNAFLEDELNHVNALVASLRQSMDILQVPS
jgi:hypothetical protein